MAKKTTRKTRAKKTAKSQAARLRWPGGRGALRWAGRALAGAVALFALTTLAYTVLNPPTTAYILAESVRYGGIKRSWVDMEDMAPEVPRAVVAAEDANFCLHWGFDMAAIREAIDQGGTRGASTLTQQTAKNLFLWPVRSFVRKAIEVPLAMWLNLVLGKRRVLEIYLNIAEWGPNGIFGAEVAARRAFRKSVRRLTAREAALLAAALPNPIRRNAARPGPVLRRLAGIYQRRAAQAGFVCCQNATRAITRSNPGAAMTRLYHVLLSPCAARCA